jgi:outer membrane autotransporter protein
MKRSGGVLGVALLVLVLVLTPMGTAKADNQKGWYVGLFAGYIIPDDLELSSPSGSIDLSLDNSYNLGIKAGYICPTFPYVAVEVEYNYMFGQDVDTQTIGSTTFTGNDVTVGAFMANLLFRYPHPVFRPYIGMGLGWAWTDVKVAGREAGVPFSISESDNNWAWQFLAGINYAFAKNWSADLGYRYFAAENFSYTDPVDGEIEMKYKNQMITLGINYHF